VGHVARVGRWKVQTYLKGRNQLGDVGVDQMIILKCIRKVLKVWTGFICLRIMCKNTN
jgi:hypothetical protein